MRICLLLILTSLVSAQNRYPLLGQEAFGGRWDPRLEIAHQSIRTEDYIAAKHILSGLLETEHMSTALYLMAQIHLELDQIDRAFKVLIKLEKQPGFERAASHLRACYNLALGQYFLRKRKWEQALDLFKKAVTGDHDPRLRESISEIYLDRVKFMRRGRDLLRKTELLAQSFQLNPAHEKTLDELAEIHLKGNQFNEAQQYLEVLAYRFPNRDRLFELAILYTYTNHIQQSLKILTRLKAEYPDDGEILEKYYQVRQFLSLRGDELEEASAVAAAKPNQISLPVEEDEPKAVLQRMYLKGEWREARDLLLNLRNEEPREWKWIAETTHFYLLQKKQEQALEFLKAQIPAFGNRFEFKLEYAKVLEGIDSTQALDFVSQEIEAKLFSKNQIQELMEIQGKLYLKIGRLETAREIFEQLLLGVPERVHASKFYLGVYYSQKKYYQKALEYFQEAHKGAPTNPRYILTLATTFRQLGIQDRAQEYVDRLLRDYPDSKYTAYARKIFQLEESLKTSEKETLPPESVSAYLRTFRYFNGNPKNENVAQIIPLLKSTRQWDQLIEVLEEFLKQNPHRPDLEAELDALYQNYAYLDFQYNLSSVATLKEISQLREDGKHAEILHFFKDLPESVKIAPKIKLVFAKAYLDLKKYTQAEKILDLLLREGDELIEYHSLMGYLFFMQKRFDDALNSYYQALSLDPSNSALLFKLAELLKTTGQSQKARLVYQEIIKLNIDEKSVQDARFFYKQLERVPGLNQNG